MYSPFKNVQCVTYKTFQLKNSLGMHLVVSFPSTHMPEADLQQLSLRNYLDIADYGQLTKYIYFKKKLTKNGKF